MRGSLDGYAIQKALDRLRNVPRPKGIPKTGGRKKGAVNGACVAKATAKLEFIKASVERVCAEYQHIAFLDIGDAFDPAGNLLPIHEMSETVRRAIAGIEVANYNVDGDGKGPVGKLHKIKLLDKGKALHDLAKHLGMFIEKVEHSGKMEFIETVADTLRARRLARIAQTEQKPR